MNHIWENVLAEIEQKVSLGNFSTWFKDTTLLSAEDGEILIGVKNTFVSKQLQSKFLNLIMETLANHDVVVNNINFELAEVKKSKVRPREIVPNDETKVKKIHTKVSQEVTPRSSLNPKYTFDNFVPCSNNELAFSVARNIIESPGVNYNPFYLYGGSGLGKTHLVQAIGNELLRLYPNFKILYTPINDFYSDFVNSIRKGKGREFSEKFNKLDCLIVDDIQMIVGKEKSQEEFFHIFNTLHNLGKQIIVTSDRLPSQIETIDVRLASRLTSAGHYDIQLPQFEDKCAILRAKADFLGKDIEEEAIKYIAENINTNIRDLEGELSTLFTISDVRGLTPLEIINQGAINISHTSKIKKASAKQVVEKVAKYYDLTVKEMCGKSRVTHIKTARQVAMFILSENLQMSTPKIAEEVGVKDHTTVMHGIKKIREDSSKQIALKNQIEEIRSKIYE